MPYSWNDEARLSLAAKLWCLLAVNAAFMVYLHDPTGPLGPRGALDAPAFLFLGVAFAYALVATTLVLTRAKEKPGQYASYAFLLGFGLIFLVRLPHDPFTGVFAVSANLVALPVFQLRRAMVSYPHPLGRAVFWTNLTASLLCLFLFGYRVLQTDTAIATVLLFAGPALLLSIVYEALVFGFTFRGGPYLEWIALAGCALALARHGGLSEAFVLTIGLRQFIVLARSLGRTDLGRTLAVFLFNRPAHLFILSFALLILAGASSLTFNAAAAPALGTRFIDALFTSTSAVCVTGLIVLDTPTLHPSASS
jgi:hypothetical protein